jgi:hypothetical protein
MEECWMIPRVPNVMAPRKGVDGRDKPGHDV